MYFVNEDWILEIKKLLKECILKPKIKILMIMKLLYIFLNYDLRNKLYKFIQIQIKILKQLMKIF